MKLKKIILSLVGVVGVGVGAWAAVNWTHLVHFPSIISSYYAKEMCSCLYVVGQSEDRCHNMVRQWLPISSYENDSQEKRVTVAGLGRTNRARFVDETYGCVLEELN